MGWFGFLNFESCKAGLAFALASRLMVRRSRGGANLGLHCHVLNCDRQRPPDLAFEDDRIKDPEFAPYSLAMSNYCIQADCADLRGTNGFK